MTKRTNVISFLVSAIFFGWMFFASPAQACTCASLCSAAEIEVTPSGELSCASGQVCCDPKPAASFPGTQGIGATCTENSDCASNNCVDTACASSSTRTKGVGDLCVSSDECPEGAMCVAESDSANNLKTCKLTGSSTPPATPPATTPSGGGETGSGWSLDSISGFGLPSGSILGIISGILVWLLSALGILGVIGFTISGIMYLTSTGDEDMIERAKKAMTWSIVGVIVGLIGVVIIQAIDWMLRGFSNF